MTVTVLGLMGIDCSLLNRRHIAIGGLHKIGPSAFRFARQKPNTLAGLPAIAQHAHPRFSLLTWGAPRGSCEPEDRKVNRLTEAPAAQAAATERMQHRFEYPKVTERSRLGDRDTQPVERRVTSRPSQRALVQASLLRCPESRPRA
jgi:hypothetical protein